MVAGFGPGFGTCILAAVVSTIAVAFLHWVLHAVLGPFGGFLSLVAGFLVNALVINALVKMPGGAEMGFGKAVLVSVVEYVIYIILCIALAIVFGAAILGGLSALH